MAVPIRVALNNSGGYTVYDQNNLDELLDEVHHAARAAESETSMSQTTAEAANATTANVIANLHSVEGETVEQYKIRLRRELIAEAERQGWCPEFDQVLVKLGMAPRSGAQVTMTFTLPRDVNTERRAREYADSIVRYAKDYVNGGINLLPESLSINLENGD